jgi:hypothetical protein
VGLQGGEIRRGGGHGSGCVPACPSFF